MKSVKFALAIVLAAVMSSCSPLKPVSIQQNDSLDNYNYVYIIPTGEVTAGVSDVYADTDATIFGSSTTRSINPADLIAGYMMKRGFVRLSELNPELLDQTLVVSYGESGRRSRGFGYAIEVTIQFLSAKTNLPVCICFGEGQGETEADDIRIAINRCLDEVFMNK